MSYRTFLICLCEGIKFLEKRNQKIKIWQSFVEINLAWGKSHKQGDLIRELESKKKPRKAGGK